MKKIGEILSKLYPATRLGLIWISFGKSG